jgi:ubiquinone/menaquinone biosynthesis C-methylase UbiE
MKNDKQLLVALNEMRPAVQTAPRWTLQDESHRLIRVLDIRPGNRVLEIGCRDGRNFEWIQYHLQGFGKLTAVDSSSVALREASRRVQIKGWKNVLLIDHDYGREPIAEGRSDVVLLSYSLSKVSNWRWVLDCAHAELRPGGRIGVVDFCSSDTDASSVAQLRAYESRLRELFIERAFQHRPAWFGTLSFLIFAGEREVMSQQEVA